MPDVSAPTWSIEVNGSPLPSGYAALISELSIDVMTYGSDELRIRAAAQDPKTGDWKIAGENVLGPGNILDVWGGYADAVEPLGRFQVTEETVNYPEGGGAPLVTIRAYSAEHRLGHHTRERVYAGPVADSDIVQAIAEEHGLTVTGDSLESTESRDAPRVKRKGISDLVFVQQLATANGYGPPLVRWDGTSEVLYFRPSTVEDPLTLIYNVAQAGSSQPTGALLSFRPTLSLSGVPTSVQVVGWDVEAQEPIVVLVEMADGGQDPTVLTGDAATAAAGYEIRSGSEMIARVLADADDPRSEVLEAINVPHLTTVDDAIAWGERWILTRNAAFMVARARTIGIPTLWAGQVHQVEGVAPHHVGLWEVIKARHVFNAQGYRCDLDLARVLEEASAPTGTS